MGQHRATWLAPLLAQSGPVSSGLGRVNAWSMRFGSRALARVKRGDWLVVVVGVTALCINLYHLGAPSIWMDEAFSTTLARLPLPALWQAVLGGEANMVLYHLILHAWLQVTSVVGLRPTEFIVRLPSAVFAAMSALVVFTLGRRFLGMTAAVVATTLFVLNGWQLDTAQEARSYSLQLLLICVAWYALFAALVGGVGRKRWWVCYFCASTLAFYSQEFSLLVLLAQIIAFASLLILPTSWRAMVRDRWREMAVSVAAIGVAVTPLIIVGWHQAKTGWLPAPHVQDLVRRIFAGGSRYSLPMLLIGACALLSLALLALSRLPGFLHLRRRVPGGREGNRSAFKEPLHVAPVIVGLACWVVVPVIVSYIASQGALRLFSSRYLTVIVPALSLFVGIGVAMIRWRWVRVVLALAILGGNLAALPSHYAHAQVEDWRTPTRWLERQYQPGDGLICYNNVQGCQIAVEYYLFADESTAHFSPDSPGAVWLTTYGQGDPFRNFADALHPAELAPFAAKHPRIFFIAGRLIDAADAARALAAERWLDHHYQFVSQVSSNVATIRLYVTGAPASAP